MRWAWLGGRGAGRGGGVGGCGWEGVCIAGGSTAGGATWWSWSLRFLGPGWIAQRGWFAEFGGWDFGYDAETLGAERPTCPHEVLSLRTGQACLDSGQGGWESIKYHSIKIIAKRMLIT